jgi:hypothetical protein
MSAFASIPHGMEVRRDDGDVGTRVGTCIVLFPLEVLLLVEVAMLLKLVPLPLITSKSSSKSQQLLRLLVLRTEWYMKGSSSFNLANSSSVRVEVSISSEVDGAYARRIFIVIMVSREVFRVSVLKRLCLEVKE